MFLRQNSSQFLKKSPYILMNFVFTLEHFVFSALYCIVGCLLFVIDIEVGPGQATIRLCHVHLYQKVCHEGKKDKI